MNTLTGLALLVLAYSADADYRCDRVNEECSGTCDFTTGVCSPCDADRQGEDCAVITSTIALGACLATSTCVNGVCYDVGGVATCGCDARWTGANCDVPEYDLACNGITDATLTVNGVNGPGYLYAVGHKATPACFAGDGTAAPTLTGILFTGGDCSSAATITGDVATMSFVHRGSNDYVQDSDELITIRCGSGDTVEQSVEIVQINADDAVDLVDIETGAIPTSADVDMVLEDGAGGALANPINLGDPVVVKLTLSTAGAQQFSDIRATTCGAYTVADKTGSSMELVATGCQAGMPLSPILAYDGTTISFGFKAFKFDAIANVFIICDVKVCENAGDCAALDCGADTGIGFGRKKRDTDGTDKTVGKVFQVIDPMAEAAKTIQELKDSKACYQTWEMTATVVALAVALVIVILICIILVVKGIVNKRSSKTYREDVSETASTAHFPHLPTIVSNKA